jgi:hypothetical protein
LDSLDGGNFLLSPDSLGMAADLTMAWYAMSGHQQNE